MDPRVETIARAACRADGLDPDERIGDPDYAGGLRSGDHAEVPQWTVKVREAARFLAMHEALAASSGGTASTSAGDTPGGADLNAGAGTSL